MRVETNLFTSDSIVFTWKDLFLLAIGRELKSGGVIVRRGGR